MADLIYRDAPLEQLDESHTENLLVGGARGNGESLHSLVKAFRLGVDYAINAVKSAPAVDAVEVVRCCECKQWGGITFGNVCRRWSTPLEGMKNCTKPDDYCSYGERRKE